MMTIVTVEEKFKLLGDDGNYYGPNGFPRGVKYVGERKSVGFVIRRGGSTFGANNGRAHDTRPEAQAAADRINARSLEYDRIRLAAIAANA